MSLGRYREYKSSGSPWFGTVPTHWEPTTLKRIVAFVESGVSVNAVDEPAGPESFGVLKTSCVYAGVFDPGENKAVLPTEIERVACPVKAKTLIVSRMNTPALVGAAGLVTESVANLFLPDRLWQVHFANAEPKFVHYWTNTPSYRAQVQMACAGTSASMQNLSQDEFLRFTLPLPPRDEQAAIVDLLDLETTKIDALITEQEKLITLLAEKRQATISHAVTKGLNPNAPMKDSGVAWLGSVPAHWELISIRYLVDAIGDVDHFMPVSVEKGIPYLMTGDLKEFVSRVSLDDCKQVSHNDYLQLSKRIKSSKGDVILARYATIGTSMYVDIDVDFLVSYSCVTLKTKHFKLSGLYLFQYMKSDAFRQGVENQINTNTQSNVGIRDLQNVKIPIPPIDEQTSIITFLDTAITKFDVLKAESERAINLLRERRTALITAAVTGQIDVRAAVSLAAAESLEAIAA